MDKDLTKKQNEDLLTLMPLESWDSFAEAKRAVFKEGLKVWFKRNGLKMN